jgi:hypothetical protein
MPAADERQAAAQAPRGQLVADGRANEIDETLASARSTS